MLPGSSFPRISSAVSGESCLSVSVGHCILDTNTRRRVPSLLRLTALAKNQEDTGAERPYLNLKDRSPGASCAAVSVCRVPHAVDLERTGDRRPLWRRVLYKSSSRCRPVVVPGGRLYWAPMPCAPLDEERLACARRPATRRTSAGKRAVPRQPPETRVRSTHAAGATPRPHFGTTSGSALVWAGMAGAYGRPKHRG